MTDKPVDMGTAWRKLYALYAARIALHAAAEQKHKCRVVRQGQGRPAHLGPIDLIILVAGYKTSWDLFNAFAIKSHA